MIDSDNQTTDTSAASNLGTLLDQLQENNTAIISNMKEIEPLKKENIEKFVIEQAGVLITESLDAMRIIKNTVITAPNNKDIEALAGLITATSTALETLNKIIVVDKKVQAVKDVKEMDVKSRKELLVAETQGKILLTREEAYKLVSETAQRVKEDPVDIAVTVSTPSNS